MPGRTTAAPYMLQSVRRGAFSASSFGQPPRLRKDFRQIGSVSDIAIARRRRKHLQVNSCESCRSKATPSRVRSSETHITTLAYSLFLTLTRCQSYPWIADTKGARPMDDKNLGTPREPLGCGEKPIAHSGAFGAALAQRNLRSRRSAITL